jgi:soluble lytic murein transglycosylase-like protein
VQPYRPSIAQTAIAASPPTVQRSHPITVASAVKKPQPIRKTTAQLAATAAAAPQPTPRGAAWQAMPGAIYATTPGTQTTRAVASAAAPPKASPNVNPVVLVARQEMPDTHVTAQPLASPTPLPGREIHVAAAHAFGDIEAEAVRYAGGPCSANIYRIAWAAADLFRIEPAFVAALIEVESGCHSDAVSVAGARGLMQLIPASGAREGYRFMYGTDRKPTLAELHDPATNIQLGVAYLGALQDHFSTIDGPMPRLILVIAAYNCGPDFLDQRLPPEAQAWNAEQAARWVSRNAPAETRAFVEAVMRKAALYSSAAITARTQMVASSRSFSP